MAGLTKYPEPLVFGLDIGTRSIVGTVGYREGKDFNIVAQCTKFHDTRAMLDGQIHDINKVGEEIVYVKEELEKQLEGRKLTEVCVAAAGRVLKTAVGTASYEFSENTVITTEHIHSLEMMGVEKAHEQVLSENDTDLKFFCVGYTVVKYRLNNYEITNLEGHKAHKIGADILATFLPEEVVDGLYAAVAIADLEISNMTLEPIAAIQVAIPENYRLLNIALVDVGAGTSDISITRDGSIIAYGMLPKAGDELTEYLVRELLCDFDTAEQVKQIKPGKKPSTYNDIMGISHNITQDELCDKLEPLVDEITGQIAEKIIELNGDKPVSAVFLVGGGGKLPSFSKGLAKHLGLPPERVALRGEEVMGFVHVFDESVTKDSLIVTPIGICLNYYEQKNRFIFLKVNGESVKLYDNDKLTVFDAALAYGMSNDDIFPKRGQDINYTLNGKKKFVRGRSGEPAVIKLNGSDVGLNHAVMQGDEIEITESTSGEEAALLLGEIVDVNAMMNVFVNEVSVEVPKMATVNGHYENESYQVTDGDVVEQLTYCTLTQLMQFMDIDTPHEVFVNGARASAETKIYENFNVAWIDKEEVEKYRAERFVSEEVSEEDEEETEDTDVAETANEKEKAVEGDETSIDEVKADSEENSSDNEATDKIESENADSKEDSDNKKTGNASKTKNKKKPDDNKDNKNKPKRKSSKKNSQKTEEDIIKEAELFMGSESKENEPKLVDQWIRNSEKNHNAKAVSIDITVNNKPITLTGKANYVFVDIFDKYDFDLKHIGGTKLIQTIDGKEAEHFSPVYNGAKLELYWKE